ncbi:9218_t:CDS:1 [Racocetra persica]|uniref:9218_t:CDS:1 n=1 Tax=Racocetra persica TaxID=160502 RepID=A0ACA9PR82_9GLOM|nr:9218_t:CDS:1 [Racocetra persica]
MYNILDQKQLAYKASANALYGGLGSPYLGIAVPVISQCVTFVAQELIKTLKKFIESYHTGEYRDDHNVICDETSEVIYGDTDSCLARLPKRILRCILKKYYSHLKYIELNNGLIKEYEELIFKMYDELTKERSIFGKKVYDAFNAFNRDCRIKIVTLEYEKLLFDLTLNNKKRYAGYKFELQSNGEPPDYFFSEIFSGAKDYISRNTKLFNKRLVFDEMINVFLTESDEFKKYAVMKRFSNIHVRGLPIVRRDANNSSKVIQQMTYLKLFDYKEKMKFILDKKFNNFDEFFEFFVNSRCDKNNWLLICLEDASKKVIKLLTQKLEPQDLYIIENSVQFNPREISTLTIIEKMKHDIFKNSNYNIVNSKLILYEDMNMSKRHHFANEIN